MSFQYVPLGTATGNPWANQRATVRYQCPPATSGRVILVDDQEFQRAWIIDLSTSGIGLQLGRPVPAGTFVVIQLKSPLTQKTYELAAHVAHATQKSNGEWVIGCELVEKLTAEDLDALL